MKIGIQNLYFLFIALISILSCRTQKEAMELKPFELKHWMSIEKNPCFGHCQVYSISLYRNGLAILEGKEHLEKKGVYFTELSKEKISRLNRLVGFVHWNNIQDEYFVNIPDLPITNFKYHDIHGAKIKDIKSNSNVPEALHSLMNTVSDLINSEKWTQIQKKNDMINPEIISHEFILDMDSSLTIASLESEFYLYNLKGIKQVSSYMNLWSVTFDEQKIGKYEMLILLRKKAGIRSANFNRKLLPRE